MNTRKRRRINTAHQTQRVGTHSELIVMTALIANGWEVSEPVVEEVYDLVARHPQITENRWVQIQTKTVRLRSDRDNQLVIYARKGDGSTYSKEDCDYIAGVNGLDVYLVENREIAEYWATQSNVKDRWMLLSAEIKRGAKEAV